MIPTTVSLVMRKVTTGIIAPHGVIDLFHSIDNKQIKKYVFTNIGASVTTGFLWSMHKDIVFVVLIALSVLHFRHQMFDQVKLLQNRSKCIQIIKLSVSTSLLVASIILKPSITYAFIAIFHTPHQYYTNRHLFSKKRAVFIIILTFLSMYLERFILCWHSNPMFISAILGHIIYQELVM